jgi:hypothetical protein
MARKILSTMAIVASSLGFAATQGEIINTFEDRECMMEAKNTVNDAPSSERPILEKCKKKKS